jgi:hypothetical protein
VRFYLAIAIAVVSSFILVAIVSALSSKLLAHLETAERQKKWLTAVVAVGALIVTWWLVDTVSPVHLLLHASR